MAVDRREANLEKLNETAQVQNQTKEAIWRIQRQAAEAEEIGNQTLDELRRQGQQMVRPLSLDYCLFLHYTNAFYLLCCLG